MLTMPYVFTSGALFQADAALVLTGHALALCKVTCEITDGDSLFCREQTTSGNDGSFSVEVHTPKASFQAYTVTVRCGVEENRMENVLFGELWLASGQSNMELPNSTHPEFGSLWEAQAGKHIRVYHVDYLPANANGNFPEEPDPMHTGHWYAHKDKNGLEQVSACAYRFATALYDDLNRSADVPVGFLNCSWGGTGIPAWFPKADVIADKTISDTLRKLDKYPYGERWNSFGDLNFQQTSSQFNLKIAPVLGVKVRGVIWYQGEHETADEYQNHVYADYLRFYHRVYTRLFAAVPERFMMVSSLIYPWTYGPSGECSIGYINRAFTDTASESPGKFAVVPCGDLMPRWAHHQQNHPIHPTHKYRLGLRMAKIAEANVYASGGQSSPALFDSLETANGALLLRFTRVGSGLRIDGPSLRGLYLAGDDGVYLPADTAEITAPDILLVKSEAVAQPVHAAYGIQSLEPMTNLFAGDYPVCPFFTDESRELFIEARPWFDVARESFWAHEAHNEYRDLFLRPVFIPGDNTLLSRDPAFTLEDNPVLRVEGQSGSASFTVKAYPYNRLDLEKFSALTVRLYDPENTDAFLRLESDAGFSEVPFERLKDLGGKWYLCKAVLHVPDGEVRRMTFRFRYRDPFFRFTMIDRPRLSLR